MKKKEKDKLSDNLPACADEFIKLVIKKMRYRRKVRQEVMAELSAHFEDELRKCTTDEQKAQQLIGQFGDVKLLAVLLRRAKKRCRPLWRTMVARTFQATGILILCLIVYLVWFFSGKPNIATDYVAELNKIVRPAADDSLNAAPLYNKAAELVENLPDDMKELLRTKYDKATAEQKQLIAKWLTDNEEALELVIAGTQKPYYWQRYKSEEDEMFSILMPHLSGFRKLAYALRWRAQLHAEQSRYEDAFDDIKSCYRLGQHIKGDVILIEQLVGMAIEALAAKTIRSILSEYQIDSDTLATLQQDFEQMIASEDFVMSLKTEKLFMYDEIQRCFTEDRLGGGHLYVPRFRKIMAEVTDVNVSAEGRFDSFCVDLLRLLNTLGPARFLFTHPNKQQTFKSVNKSYDYFEELALKTPAQLRTEHLNIDEEFRRLADGNLFLQILTPAFGKVIEIGHRNKADVEAALTIIAILRYGQDVGGYPDNLDKLIETGYLKELPMDAFSDKPLIYKKTDDDFILYSVSLNFKDDGGQAGKDKKGRVKVWADNGDAAFWPIRR